MDHLQHNLLDHYDKSHRTLVAALASKLDAHQRETVQSVLTELEHDRVSQQEMSETLAAVQQALGASPAAMSNTREVAAVLSDPSLDVKTKLKLSLPVIPLLLAYEVEIGLGSGVNLKRLWTRLMRK